jgi:hypothetical protein
MWVKRAVGGIGNIVAAPTWENGTPGAAEGS